MTSSTSAAASSVPLNSWKEWNIPAGNEHRFEVPFDVSFTFRLEAGGTAEIYGSELAPHREYTVSGCKLAIFTFTGARISYHGGPCSVEYLSSESSQAQEALLNLQVALEGFVGGVARVLLVGAGRNTVGRTLLNYAVRRGADCSVGPVLVDLDVANGSICIPGTISAISPSQPLPIESATPSSDQTISLFYGSTALSDNPKVYERLCERMGQIVQGRIQGGKTSLVLLIAPNEVGGGIGSGAGGVANTSNNNNNTNNTQLLNFIQKSFGITHILVIGNERLHVTITKNINTNNVTVLKIPRATGVVSKDAAFRRDSHAKAFKSYFYGSHMEFHPFSVVVAMDDVVIYRVADAGSLAPSSALPLGATRKIDATKLAKVTNLAASNLLYSILALVHQPSNKDEDFDGAIDTPVLGFLHVISVNESEQTFTVSSPCPGALPSKFLLSSSLKWIEK
jgi:polyribonucleotide 5'-hydroxyl-kinase